VEENGVVGHDQVGLIGDGLVGHGLGQIDCQQYFFNIARPQRIDQQPDVVPLLRMVEWGDLFQRLDNGL